MVALLYWLKYPNKFISRIQIFAHFKDEKNLNDIFCFFSFQAARLIKAAVKQQTARIDDEVDGQNNTYSETVDADTYIEEDYLVDADDSDGNTYLIEYVNDEDGIDEDLANELATNGLVEEMAEDNDTTSDEYSCNHCGMHFKNVDEHIQKYHSNDEVVIDMEEYSSDVKAEGTSIDSTDFDIDTDANILPDNDETEYQSGVLEIEDDNNIIESTSDMENCDVYEYDETIEGEDESQPMVTVSSHCSHTRLIYHTTSKIT